MKTTDSQELEHLNIKKELGNSKVVCLTGGPCSQKKILGRKMEEELGYKYISSGDLLRKEILKGTKEGDRVRKLMQDGAIIPYETVVHCIMKEMIENKSKNYVIEGFPRA